jgi:hypothetical protein
MEGIKSKLENPLPLDSPEASLLAAAGLALLRSGQPEQRKI